MARSACALLHDGLLEYEVVDDGRELALTLLRATGWLSRSEPSLRPNPAGPPVAVHGAQMLGERRVQYAVMPHRGDWRAADCYGAADAFTVPFERVRGGRPGGPRPDAGQALHVDGAEVSAVHRTAAGALVVRVFRTATDTGPVTIEHDGAPARGWVIDLAGRPVAPFEGAGRAAAVAARDAAARVNARRLRGSGSQQLERLDRRLEP